LDSFSDLSAYKLEKNLLGCNRQEYYRNRSYKIICSNRGGGTKRLYRRVDFERNKLNWSGVVKGIHYDPNRNAYLALITYQNGEKKYIISASGLQVGRVVISGFQVCLNVGNSLPLWNIPLGINIHNVEFRMGAGAQLSRSAGTSVKLIARKNGLVALRLPSGQIRLVPQTCWATIGQVGNIEISNTKIGKAGRIRWLGWRPKVRGSVINPVDHPHGGGEGRCPIGRSRPCTPWGKPRVGVKTRRTKKYSDTFIFRRQKLLYCTNFMPRSLKKGPFVANSLLQKIERRSDETSNKVLHTWSRSSIIIPIIIGYNIFIHNGKSKIPVFITDQIVGHKLGEFAPTRTFRRHTKLDKKRKR
jgi:large subunit ribosomal protein L2